MTYEIVTRPFGVYVYVTLQLGAYRFGRFRSAHEALVWVFEVIERGGASPERDREGRKRRPPGAGKGRRASGERLREALL